MSDSSDNWKLPGSDNAAPGSGSPKPPGADGQAGVYVPNASAIGTDEQREQREQAQLAQQNQYNNLFNQILVQQGANDKQKKDKSSSFRIGKALVVKVLMTVVLCGIGYKFYLDRQAYFKRREIQMKHRADRKDRKKMGSVVERLKKRSNNSDFTNFQKMTFKKDDGESGASFWTKVKSMGRKIGGGDDESHSFAAINPELVAEKLGANLDLSNLIGCANNAAWSGYASKGYYKLTDDYSVSYYKNHIGVFSPYHVGFEKIFKGMNMKKPLTMALKALGKNYLNSTQKVGVILPYHSPLPTAISGNIYLKIYREHGVLTPPVFRYGRNIMQEPGVPYRLTNMHNKIWKKKKNSMNFEKALGTLKSEITRQVGRFKRSKGVQRFFATEDGVRPSLAKQFYTLNQCTQVAKKYDDVDLLKAIDRWQGQMILASRKKRLKLSPLVAMRRPWVSSQSSFYSIARIAGYNTVYINQCFKGFRAPVGSWSKVSFQVRSDGQVSKVKAVDSRGLGAGGKNCIRSAFRKMTFPPTKKKNVSSTIIFDYR